ncbi:MAG: DUF1345 domain-containing protein [Pseudochelatococcus sp.]|jgi:uncharacterized membrane protein|uniref:DUF1345 domain-containing protein n=1 Tax=Pseudochelatococcus sp. TaxID=2020869 RepID=UPI003D89B667
MTRNGTRRRIGNIIAPARFIAFAAITVAAGAAAIPVLGWGIGFMTAFDVAAAIFLLSCMPLLDNEPSEMRTTATVNDANRSVLLALSGLVMVVILAAIASILSQDSERAALHLTLIVVTLVLSWAFSNTVYALHYAHIFYSPNDAGHDRRGLAFPGTAEPNYIDFTYFSFCLGMAFQTSDVEVTNSHMRLVVTLHCTAAFIFNLGVLAFTINVLGGMR